MSGLSKANKSLTEGNTPFKENLLQLEYHQRRNKLVFDGIPEVKGETDFSCYEEIWNILVTIPIMNVDDIYTAKCHRPGHFQQWFTRRLIAYFHWYGDPTETMNKRQYLPPIIFVRYDYPEEWQNCKWQPHPIFKLAKFKDQYKSKCSLQKHRLVIDGGVYQSHMKQLSRTPSRSSA